MFRPWGEGFHLSEINLCLEEFLTTKKDLGLLPPLPLHTHICKGGQDRVKRQRKVGVKLGKRNDVKVANREGAGS